MKLITKELSAKMPKFRAQEKTRDPIVYAKLFCPWGAATWWLTEYDAKENLAFGFAYLGDEDMAELGYISITELSEVSGPFGLKVERDIHFSAVPMSEALSDFGLHRSAAKFK
jgi:hypothetical protein